MIIAIQPSANDLILRQDATIALTSIELIAVSEGFGTFWGGFVHGACMKNKEIV